MRDDAKALYKQMLGDERSESEYLEALRRWVFIANTSSLNAAKYAEIEQILDEALNARPNSWRVKIGVAKLLNVFPKTGYMEDGAFVHAPGQREDIFSCEERLRVRKLQLYAEALPLVREELDRLSKSDEVAAHDAELVRSEASEYYLAFARLFQKEGARGYWSQQTLTDLSALPDYVPFVWSDGTGFKEIPVDDEGVPVFFAVPDSFETAKNDGERRQALLNELLERLPASKPIVLFERADEAQDVFGVRNLHPFCGPSSPKTPAPTKSRAKRVFGPSTRSPITKRSRCSRRASDVSNSRQNTTTSICTAKLPKQTVP